MKYAGIIKNDIAAAPGICVSFFTQGCPHRCPGCHNPETWDFEGGKEFSPKVIEELITALTANNIKRNLCIMGGEPLCPENTFLTFMVITEIKKVLPDTKIYIWTGYTIDELLNHNFPHIKEILLHSDYLIDGPFILAQRDITLPMRGSTNQRVISLDFYKNLWYNKDEKEEVKE